MKIISSKRESSEKKVFKVTENSAMKSLLIQVSRKMNRVEEDVIYAKNRQQKNI